MKRGKLFRLLCAIFLTLILVAMPLTASCAKPASKSEPVVLSAISFLPQQHMDKFGMWWLRDRVAERSEGQLTIEYKGGPETIPIFEQFGAVQKGVVDIVMGLSGTYARQLPEVNALNLTELAPWELRESGFYDHLVERHKELGVFYLGWPMSQVPWYTYTKFPVNTIDDFKGKKIIRTTDQGNEFVKALGAQLLRPKIAELYTSLERGVADGLMYPVSAPDIKLEEVVTHVVDHPFYIRNSLVWLVNLDTWNGLSKDNQDLLIDVMKGMERDAEARDTGRIAGYIKIMKDAGLKFVKLPPADAKRFIDLAYDTEWEKLKSRLGPEDYEKVRKLVIK